MAPAQSRQASTERGQYIAGYYVVVSVAVVRGGPGPLGPGLCTIPAYLSKRVARCMGPVLVWGPRRGDSGSLGPGLCGMLDADFREHPFHALR
jgi:hypothetical protein